MKRAAPRASLAFYIDRILICTKLVIRRFLVFFFLCMHLFIFCPGFIAHLFYRFPRVRGDNKKITASLPCRNIEVERCFIAEKKSANFHELVDRLDDIDKNRTRRQFFFKTPIRMKIHRVLSQSSQLSPSG
jgi:hypothetical protein